MYMHVTVSHVKTAPTTTIRVGRRRMARRSAIQAVVSDIGDLPSEARLVRVQPKPPAKPHGRAGLLAALRHYRSIRRTNKDADNPLTRELVEWADIIFVMEKRHRSKLQQRFRSALKTARVICLDIPDNYAFMDPVLVRMLETKVSRYLPLPRSS